MGQLEQLEQLAELTSRPSTDVCQRYPVHHAIVQLTSFCNISCDYCYLPNRDLRNKASPQTVALIARRICEYPSCVHPLIWSWHAGEPFSVGLAHFRECHEAARSVFSSNRIPVSWAVQTNGTLITGEWADFLYSNHYNVSLSIDGPPFLHDRRRRHRSGLGSYAKAIKGFELLKSRGRAPPVLMVITEETLQYGREIASHFGDLGVQSLAFNFAEIEGTNRSSFFGGKAKPSAVLRDEIRRFIDDLVGTRDRCYPGMEIREHDNFADFILSGAAAEMFVTVPMHYLTFGQDGSVFGFCPELAGHVRTDGTDFSFGSVAKDSLQDVLERILASEDYRQIIDGKSKCRATCDYFEACGGGNPGNKYFENGSFATTETEHCRLKFQYLVDAMLEYIGK